MVASIRLRRHFLFVSAGKNVRIIRYLGITSEKVIVSRSRVMVIKVTCEISKVEYDRV